MDWNLRKILLMSAQALTISIIQLHAAKSNANAGSSYPPAKTNGNTTAPTTSSCPHYFAFGDALYLKAQEDGLDYAVIDKSPVIAFDDASGQSPQHHGKFKNGSASWDWGFRVGLGYNFNFDHWYVGLSWTQFNTENTRHSSPNLAKETLFPTRTGGVSDGGLPAAPLFIVYFADKAKAQWDLHYTTLDLDLGRYCKINRFLSLTPFVSLRAAKILQDFDITYTNPNYFTGGGVRVFFPKDKVDITNNMWGIGPRLGLNTHWMFSPNFGFYANGSIALLWERFHVSTKETQTLPDGSHFVPMNVHEGEHEVNFNAQVALGFQYDQDFSEGKYHLNLGIGWEQIIWLDQNQTYHFLNTVNVSNMQKEHSNFNLSGVRLGARLDF
ncbi:MAG: hypothetical protein JSS10_08950 [Verrucomicrobia bacterium]|nr:hypothetical protein [Verrucomicrobiota bacterium]